MKSGFYLVLLLAMPACGGSSTPPPSSGDGASSSASPSAEPAPSGDPAAAPSGSAAASAAPSAAPTGPDESKVMGKLTQNDIAKVVEANGQFFDSCYTLGAGKGQQFVATVKLKVTLGPSGKPNEVKVVTSTAKNKKVDDCVVEGFKKIQFPAPKDGATSVFTFPMSFGGATETEK